MDKNVEEENLNIKKLCHEYCNEKKMNKNDFRETLNEKYPYIKPKPNATQLHLKRRGRPRLSRSIESSD